MARNAGELLGVVRSVLERGASIRFEREGLAFEAGEENAQGLAILQGFLDVQRRGGLFPRVTGRRPPAKKTGRPKALDDEDELVIRARLAEGVKKVHLAAELDVGRATLHRFIRERELEPASSPGETRRRM